MLEEIGALRIVSALIFVLALIGVLAWVLRRVQQSNLVRGAKEGRRLAIQEQLYLDPKRKLLLVRCDEQEHLLLLGPQSELHVATQTAKVEDDDKA